MKDEADTLNRCSVCGQHSAPKTYELMKRVLYSI